MKHSRSQFTTCLAWLALAATARAQVEVHFLMTDRGGNKVARFDYSTGQPVSHFVGSGISPLKYPIGLTYGPDGHLYVASSGTHSVLRYDGQSGEYLGEFVAPFSGGLTQPHALTFGPDHHLYISSWDGNRVLRYDGETGAFMDSFVPSGAGGLSGPTGLAFGPGGDLYITSYLSDSVKRYDGDSGAFIEDFVPARAGDLRCPHGLAFDSDDRLYVTNGCGDSVVVRAPDGTVTELVPPGSHGLVDPEGIAVGPDGALVVVTRGAVANAMRFDRMTGEFLGLLGLGAVGGLSQERAHLVFIPESTECRADFNDDGRLDFFDFLEFQDAFAAGCP